MNGVYWGYNPFTDHLLTSSDIQAAPKTAEFRKTKQRTKIAWMELTQRGIFYDGQLRIVVTCSYIFHISNVGVSYVIIGSESPDTTILACQKQPHSAVCDALAEP